MPLLPSRSRRAAEASRRGAVRRSPTWLLVKKELRLQVMTALAPTLFVAGCCSRSAVPTG